jgi:DNA-binding CsgD family transcriptional regulator
LITIEDVRFLLDTSSQLERRLSDLEGRRLAFISALTEAVEGKASFWGWGRGRPFDSSVTPVASIQFGFEIASWPQIVSMALSDEVNKQFNRPLMKFLDKSREVCVSRSEIWHDNLWYQSEFAHQLIHTHRLDHFLVCVHYLSQDSWTHWTVFRQAGKDDFSVRDRQLVLAALSGVVWMKPSISESIPAEAFRNLSQRRRTVMLLLLEGLARKEIANRLQLTLHTVNDHIKAIFEHFQVKSATQLAARFLKSLD